VARKLNTAACPKGSAADRAKGQRGEGLGVGLTAGAVGAKMW